MTSLPAAPSLDQCENEPIHIPGSIQPFGILLSVESATLTITNASVNCIEAFGLDARELVNRSLAEHLSADALQKLEQYIHSQDLVEQAPLIVPLLHAGSLREQEWEVTAHLHHGVLILELEPLSSEDVAEPLQRLVRNAVHLIFGASRLIDLCRRAAEQVRLISGYDRVMIIASRKTGMATSSPRPGCRMRILISIIISRLRIFPPRRERYSSITGCA